MTKEVPRTSVLRDEELNKTLIAWLRDGCNLQQKDGERAADRIEALSVVNAALTADRDKQAGYKEDYRAAYGEACLQLQETEAKLAECLERNALLEARLGKAVEALEFLEIAATGSGVPHPKERELLHDCIRKARTTLAEIKSGVATTPYGLEGEGREVPVR